MTGGPAESTTRDRILDAAEHLFASRGFSGVSLRAIIKEAGVNTAAVHYYFGSKEGLVMAVLERRAAPVNHARLARLDEIEARHPGGALPVEEVVAAFLRPAVDLYRAAAERPWLPRLMGRALTEADRDVRAIIFRIFDEVFERFARAFARALPGLSRKELEMRMQFMIGAMVFCVAFSDVPLDIEDNAEVGDLDRRMQQLVAFIAAGMRVGARPA